ncbi:NucA/NucB deoxyribonuclease domain-containing protein [Actinomadura mexicana]|uniref:NucA/NucB deoxyribonuclease domain-containing protein n=1 Tax=Actinomadura mexicana TaxID=134959 RepID=UPI000B77C779
MGNAAAATFYMDYKVADTKYGDYREVVKHNLYAIRVRDNYKHYGDIQYGSPLHRSDPVTHDQNRATICTTAYQQKASSLGLSCDEYPYASSEEGGTQNPRFSCAFLPLTQNTAHGNALNNRLFRENRILPALNEGGHRDRGAAGRDGIHRRYRHRRPHRQGCRGRVRLGAACRPIRPGSTGPGTAPTPAGATPSTASAPTTGVSSTRTSGAAMRGNGPVRPPTASPPGRSGSRPGAR